MKWTHGNYYEVEEGYEAKEAILNTMLALNRAEWLRDAVKVKVVKCIVQKKLDELDVGGMSMPSAEKWEESIAALQKYGVTSMQPAYPNPILINEDGKLLDGYTTYLFMKEKGMTKAACIMVSKE